MSDRLISRREILKRIPFALTMPAVLTSLGCNTPAPVKPEQARVPTPIPTLAQKELEAQTIRRQILADIDRLSETYPEGSVVRKFYTGRLTEISPVLTSNLKFELIDPKITAARVSRSNRQWSDVNRFRYRTTDNKAEAEFKTLKSMDITLYLPPTWLGLSDLTKKIILEKEAYTIAQFESFALYYALRVYKDLGTFEKIDPKLTGEETARIDPQLTEEEIARTVANIILDRNKQAEKLFDDAGYLAVFKSISELPEADRARVLEELSFTDLPKIYKQAEDLGIPFKNLGFGSREFIAVAYGSINSPWVRLVLNPSTPGPYKP